MVCQRTTGLEETHHMELCIPGGHNGKTQLRGRLPSSLFPPLSEEDNRGEKGGLPIVICISWDIAGKTNSDKRYTTCVCVYLGHDRTHKPWHWDGRLTADL